MCHGWPLMRSALRDSKEIRVMTQTHALKPECEDKAEAPQHAHHVWLCRHRYRTLFQTKGQRQGRV